MHYITSFSFNNTRTCGVMVHSFIQHCNYRTTCHSFYNFFQLDCPLREQLLICSYVVNTKAHIIHPSSLHQMWLQFSQFCKVLQNLDKNILIIRQCKNHSIYKGSKLWYIRFLPGWSGQKSSVRGMLLCPNQYKLKVS